MKAAMPLPGSSPHTRGAHQRAPVCERHQGIIPAYAGSTVAEQCTHWVTSDHPRIRGEHYTGYIGSRERIRIIPAYAGSTRRRPRVYPISSRIIPAYAGSTPASHPLAARVAGSSPHTRGARRFIEDDSEEDEDHPRIRGEHRGHSIRHARR